MFSVDLPFERLARQHDVFLRPAVDLAAMRTGETWTFEFGLFPRRFLNCAAGGREFGRRGAAHEDPFDDGAAGRFQRTRERKIIHFSR